MNLYTYCRNNPIRYVDPSGHSYAVLPDGTKMSINSPGDVKKFEELRDEQRANALISKKQIESFECLGTKWADVSNESVDELNRLLNEYDITETWEIQHFMSQVTLETGYGNSLTEDTDGQYLEPGTFAGDNVGNTQIGDGFKYRGGGYIHLTGRYNYNNFATYIGNDKILSESSEYVAAHYAWESAVWYWSNYVSDDISEYSTVEDVTREINGGTNGLEDRKLIYGAWSEVFK